MASRIEELRKKLTKEPLDEAFLTFNSQVEEFLRKDRSASALGSVFTQKLFEDFQSSKPSNSTRWLTEKLDGLFGSEQDKPRWPDEPDWCFLDDEPMTFLHQFTDLENCSFFVFRGYRKTEGGGKRAVFKMMAQHRIGRVRLDGEIRG